MLKVRVLKKKNLEVNGMQLRFGRRKLILSSPVASPSCSSLFFTPRATLPVGYTVSTPFPSVREQKEEKETRIRKIKMADTVAALDECLTSTQGKVDRIRQSIVAADHNHGKFSIHALKVYVKTVDAAYNDFNGFLNRVYLVDPTQREAFEPKFIEFEELYQFVRISLAEMIQHHEDDAKPIAELGVAERQMKVNSINQPSGSGVTAPVQLVPYLLLHQTPLPTFDGSYENWYKFKDRFTDIVNKCAGDSPATKLHFLDKALVGKAKGAIDQQTLNDNNYEGAWRILATKFENLRMVVQAHIAQLLSLRQMTKCSHAELTNLLDLVEKRLESLEFHNLKMVDNLSEALIVHLVISKLDIDTRKAWEATMEHGTLPKYKQTIKFLRQHCYMLERCEQSFGHGKARRTQLRFTMKAAAWCATLIT